MIDDGMPGVSITIAASPAGASLRVVGRDLIAAPSRVRSAKSRFSVDGIGKMVLVGAVVILLLPAMIIVSVVAILVPCFLRVPVCGTSGR